MCVFFHAVIQFHEKTNTVDKLIQLMSMFSCVCRIFGEVNPYYCSKTITNTSVSHTVLLHWGDTLLYCHEHMAAVVGLELICHGAVRSSAEHQMCINPREIRVFIKCNVWCC